MRVSSAPAVDPEHAPANALLVVRLDGDRYALPLTAVSEVSECGPLRPLPRAPACVLGLAERCGRIVTVLDLASLVGHPSRPGPRCLVRLASPLDHVALAVPASPRHVTLAAGAPPDGAEARGAPPVLLDPERLLSAAESGVLSDPLAR